MVTGTALLFAALGGHDAVAKLVLDRGADVAATDNKGATALMVAARGGHEAVAKLLLDHAVFSAYLAFSSNLFSPEEGRKQGLCSKKEGSHPCPHPSTTCVEQKLGNYSTTS